MLAVRQRVNVHHHADGLLALRFAAFRLVRHHRLGRRSVGHGVTGPGARRLMMEHHVRVRRHAGRALLEHDVRRGRFEVRRELRARGGRLHEVVRDRTHRRREEHGRPELVAEPFRTASRRRVRVRQEPVHLLRRPDGHVPRLLRHHVLAATARLGRRCPVRCAGHVLHHVQHALGRERRPVRGQLREVRPAAEVVRALRGLVNSPGRLPVVGIVRQVFGERPVQPHPSAADAVVVRRPVGRLVCRAPRTLRAPHSGRQLVRRAVNHARGRGARRMLVLHVLRVADNRADGRGRLRRLDRVVEEREVHLEEITAFRLPVHFDAVRRYRPVLYF